MDTEMSALSESLITEIFNALGLSRTGWARRSFGPLFRKATDRLSEIGMTFDRLVQREGFTRAAGWALTNWCTGVTARGIEQVPPRGPLLVVSNHPGTYDALVICSQLRRDDVRIVASDIPFLMELPHARQQFIFISRIAHDRMRGFRVAMRHLRQGGALLIYGSGYIDPDPDISGEAVEHIERWSPSLEMFLRLVPETKVLLTLVSRVVSAGWARSPLTWMQREPKYRRRLAEFGQVLQQLLFPGSLYLSPCLSFDAPLGVESLYTACPTNGLLPALVRREKQLLAQHLEWTGRPMPMDPTGSQGYGT